MKNTVEFLNDFSIKGMADVFYSGIYEIDSPKEIFGNFPNAAHLESNVALYVPMDPGYFGCDRTLSISLQELYKALMRDRQSTHSNRHPHFPHPIFATLAPIQNTNADRRALERAENEGMTLHPDG
jgi:hypothetical protein